jgi:hypothetical protein
MAKINDIIGRLWLFCLSAMLSLVFIVFSFSPIAWKLGGRKDQEYPELIFIIYGLPTSFILLIAGGWILLMSTQKKPVTWRNSKFFWLGIGGIFCLGLITFLIFLLPEYIVPTFIVQFALDNYVKFGIPMEIFVLVISCASAVTKKM